MGLTDFQGLLLGLVLRGFTWSLTAWFFYTIHRALVQRENEMPRATVDSENVERHELKTAPPDGFVVVRRLSYGQVLQRRSMMKLEVAAGGKGKSLEGELALADQKYTLFDFQHCIVEHNLEDPSGRKLNLGTLHDLVQLDPKIGQEIEEILSELNDLDDKDEEDLGSGSAEQS
jgi:hypothetical protein